MLYSASDDKHNNTSAGAALNPKKRQKLRGEKFANSKSKGGAHSNHHNQHLHGIEHNQMKLPGISTQKAANVFQGSHPISFEENSITVHRQKSLNHANSFNYNQQTEPIIPSKGITPK